MSKSCFVVSTIGKRGSAERKHADLVLNCIVRPVLEGSFGYKVARGDEQAYSGMITVDIITAIRTADVVVADLSFLNPNVFYELALRHAAKRPAVHIATDGTVLPFDNAGYRTIFYDLGDWERHQSAKTELAAAVDEIESPAFRVTNPVTIAEFQERHAMQQRALDEALQALEHRVQDALSAPLPPGRITKAGVSELLGGHRDSILEVVQALRRKIDESAGVPSGVRVTEVGDMLKRLGVLEDTVLGSNALH